MHGLIYQSPFPSKCIRHYFDYVTKTAGYTRKQTLFFSLPVAPDKRGMG